MAKVKQNTEKRVIQKIKKKTRQGNSALSKPYKKKQRRKLSRGQG